MNAVRLTLRNSFKNAFNSLSQLFGLIILTTILALVVSLMTAIYTGVIGTFNELVADSNLRTMVVDMPTEARVKTGSDETAAGDIPKNNVEAQQMYLYKLNRKYQLENPQWEFDWSRTEERNFSGLKNNQYNLKVKAIAKTTPHTSKNLVDALVVGNGHNIETTRQTVVDATFAKRNNLKIGDIVRYQADDLGDQLLVKSALNTKTSDFDRAQIATIEDLDNPDDTYNSLYSTYTWFQIVGLGESADYMMPTMDAQTPLANKNTELLAYVHPSLFGLIQNDDRLGLVHFDEARMVLAVQSSADRDAYYSIRLHSDNQTKPKKYSRSLADRFNDDLITLTGRPRGPTETRLVYSNDDDNYKYYTRVWTIIRVINIYNILSGLVLIVVLFVVLFTIGLITRKQVERTRSQIGLMKALGYTKRIMILNYSVLPFITSIIGSILGFAIAQPLQILITNNLFGSYFNLDFPIWQFDWFGFILVVVVMWLLITAIAFLIAYLIMKDNTLSLMNGQKQAKISSLGKFIKGLNFVQTTPNKMRFALLASSIGKMSAVSLVVFIATILMTLSFAMPELLHRNQTKSYTGIKYKQMVEYGDPVYNNPYSFMQTYDPTVTDGTYKFSPGLNKITGMPVVQDADGKNYSYDMDSILNMLTNQKIANEYYGLEINTDSPLPAPIQVMLANQKMLNSRGVMLTNHYMRAIADLAQKDGLGWNILNNQWPGYLSMIEQIQTLDETYLANPTQANYVKTLIEDFYLLQSFYKTYMESIGLTITRDYYYNQGDEALKAYKNHDYAKQIQFFNAYQAGRNEAFNSYQEERKNGKKAFGEMLATLKFDDKIRLADGTGNLAINSLRVDGQAEPTLDPFLTTNPESLLSSKGVSALETMVADYLFWYGAYFSQRSGNAIIQAAFSRPPYYVQQLFKEAYNANEPNVTYHFAFGLVPFNPDQEQLGLKLSAMDRKNHDLKFNIYGIENNNRFLDLRDHKGNDLMETLFKSRDANALVINQSMAVKFNLKTGDEVDFDVMYQELQKDNVAYSVNDWTQPVTRPKRAKDGFVSRYEMDGFSTTLTDPDVAPDDSGKTKPRETVKISAGSLNMDNTPSEYYNQVLAGKINTVAKSSPTKFKVVGIHDGFGTMQGWMKNDEVLTLSHYRAARNYLWTNFFAPQFQKEFTKAKYARSSWAFNYDLTKMSYQAFLDFFVNPKNPNRAAVRIDRIFKNAYPIFNYKYSLNDDIADLQSGISTFVNYGDYSPIAMNGGQSAGVSFDGIGASAISGLIPIKISQDILAQLSNVVQAVIILLIVLIVTMTFIIILLTTSLIINDNIRFISTLKVLGYSNRNIAEIVLGMYAIVIVIMFAIGYVAGWFIFAAIIKNLAMNTTLVLPIVYPIWLIFAVGAGVLGIYCINFAIGYRSVARANATQVLQNQEI